jgi:hypothetical protein
MIFMKTRKRPPFSIYPKPGDIAEATKIAEADDLHLSQVFLRAFRQYVKRRQLRAERRRRPALAQ